MERKLAKRGVIREKAYWIIGERGVLKRGIRRSLLEKGHIGEGTLLKRELIVPGSFD